MITFAVKTFGGVETENAYKAGLAFNRSIAEADAKQDGPASGASTYPSCSAQRARLIFLR